MNLLYANFTDSTINYGNHIIEYATRFLLRDYLGNVSIKEFDSFSEDIPKGEFDSLFIPGCTMITPGQNKSLDSISDFEFDSYCYAGSLWYPTTELKLLIKRRPVTLYKRNVKVDFSIVKNLKGIIGCRDFYTYKTLKDNGFTALYTGCPTLFLKDDNVSDRNFVLFSFGRHNFYKQVYYGRKIAKKYHVIGIVHEINDYERAKAAGWNLPLIDYSGDVDLYLSYFKSASYVVTGRLHGLLPALAFGKESFYFGTNDTRTSIIHHLGLNIYSYSEIPNFRKYASKIKNPAILEYFKNNLDQVAKSIFS